MGRRKKLPTVLSDEELRAIVRSPYIGRPRPRLRHHWRNAAMYRVLAATGLRAAELLALRVQDIEWTSATSGGDLRVRNGKGGKDRIVRLGQSDVEFLREYRREVGIRKGLLFRGPDGGALQYRGFARRLKKYAHKVGIEPGKVMSPHVFRHTFATNLYHHTNDIVAVSMALGHSDISTTMIYTHVRPEGVLSATASLSESMSF